MIICELCTNWNDIKMAKDMIKVCHDINPNGLVKAQLFNAEDDKGKPHYDWVKAHELTLDQAKMLFDYGASIGQEVFFSVFAPIYVDWCERIGVKRYKIAAGMRDQETWKAISRAYKPAFISYSTRNNQNYPYGIANTTHLYCPPGYPQLNINKDMMFEFEGFSDHTIGLDAAKIALARGARIVEKHFALEHNPAYPDDAWSMTPEELRELVKWEKICQEVL